VAVKGAESVRGSVARVLDHVDQGSINSGPRPSKCNTLRGDLSGGLRGGFIEGNHAAFEIVFEHLAKRLFQQSSPSPRGEDLQSGDHIRIEQDRGS
jgi:hypothetical protein